MTQTKAFLRPASLALIFGLSTIAAGAAYAQGPATGTHNGKRMERIAERMKDRCEKLASTDRKLTADQVRDIIAGRLAERGNSNLKIGAVKQTGDVVSVAIVTAKENSLVTTRELSTKTGLPPQATERCDKLDERINKARDQRADAAPREQRREQRRDRLRGHNDGFGRGGFGPGFDGGFGGGFGLMAGGPDRDLNLSAEQVKTLAEARLIMLGNPRLKVGAVKAQEAGTYLVDIVTVDNALVEQRTFGKNNGRGKPEKK